MTGSLQIKNGIYYAVLNFKDKEGKRKQKWISTDLEIKGNKKRADKILHQLQDEWADRNIHYDKLLVSDYFKSWLEEQSNLVSPNTLRSYISNMQNHIIPYFEEKKIKILDLKSYHLEAYYLFLSQPSSRKSGVGSLSAQTIKHHHQNISKALNDAVRKEIIRFNPAINAKTPKVNKFVGKFLNPKQISVLLSVYKDSVISLPIILIATYGLRRSEALALSWGNIDFDNMQFTVASAILQNTGGDYLKKTTKNDSSYRTLPLTRSVAAVLNEQKLEQQHNRNLFGSEYCDSDYICTWPDGKLITPNYLTRSFTKIIAKSELPQIRVHDLRHSAASNLLAMGFSIVEVQE